MNVDFYLCITKTPRYPGAKVRTSIRSPALAAGEIAIRVNLNMPDALFARPALRASIKVPEDQVSRPVINAEVVDNIKAVLQEQLGVDLAITLVQP